MVLVTVCASSSQVPAWRMSYSVVTMRAPVGQTATQLPQKTHAESGRATPNSVEISAPKPRSVTEIA